MSLQMSQPVNAGHVVQALTAIHTPATPPEQIHLANAFLTDCETKADFPLVLLDIYAQTGDLQLQLSSILLFANVVRRNWTTRGKGTIKSGMDKEQLKGSIMKACLLHQMRHYKHFNALLKTLVRSVYPTSYPELQEFVVGSLQNMGEMASNNPQQFLTHPYTVPVLSMVKCVVKEYSGKRISHCEDDFKQYVTPIVAGGVKLSRALQSLIKEGFNGGNQEVVVALLQMVRKADKIVLYGLLTMPAAYQGEAEIATMIRETVAKIKDFDDILSLNNLQGGVREEIEKYLIGILDLVTKIQHMFPFLFTDFLRDYLLLLMNMLMRHVLQGRYLKQKLISVILIGNVKPINTYPYYTAPADFQASIYCRKSSCGNNNELQTRCYSLFKEVYSDQVVEKLLVGLVSEIMTLGLVWEAEKDGLEELVLQDVEIAIVDQVGEPTAYENSLTLCKTLLKNFKEVGLRVIVRMLQEVVRLRGEGVKGSQIVANLIEITLFLPQVINDVDLPLNQVNTLLSLLYEQKRYRQLSKLIRKYHQFMDSKLGRNCFQLLVSIVSSPINEVTTPEVIYQSALALKSLLRQSYQFDSLSGQALVPCVGNLINIMGMKQFVTNPTLLWPVINLIIKLLSTCYQSDQIEALGIAVVTGIGPLLASNNNEQLLTCALVQLMACILHLTFSSLKNDYPLQGVVARSEVQVPMSSASLVVYQGALALVRGNLGNPALQNCDVVYRLWLCLLSHYPTLRQQALMGLDAGGLNGQLVQLFEGKHMQVLNDCTVIFLQILEEMYLIGLIPLDEQKVGQLIMSALNEQQDENKRIRTVLESVSLYLSYALTCSHVPQLLGLVLGQLIFYRNKISPPINTLRCFLYLALDHFILTRSAVDAYLVLTSVAGNFQDWFQPYIYSMQYVSTKEISKLNAAALLKAMGEIGVANFARMLLTAKQGQLPMDWLLRSISAKLDGIPEQTQYHQDYLYKSIIPNDFTPDFGVVKFRKLRLQFGNVVVKEVLGEDLRGMFRERFGAMLGSINWGVDDLEERVGYGSAVAIANLLGWPTEPRTK